MLSATPNSDLNSRPIIFKDFDLRSFQKNAWPFPWRVVSLDGKQRASFTARCAVWSPQANRLAFVDDSGVYLSTADGAASSLLKFETGGLPSSACPAWSSDGRYIAVADNRNGAGITIIDAMSAAAKRTSLSRTHLSQFLQWTPDSKKLITGDFMGANEASVITVADGSVSNVPNLNSRLGLAHALLNDGVTFITISQLKENPEYTINKWQLGPSAATPLLPYDKQQGLGLRLDITSQLALSPDKTRFAVTGRVGAEKHDSLVVFSLSKGVSDQPPTIEATVDLVDYSMALGWSPDGSSLAVIDGAPSKPSVRVYDLKGKSWSHVADLGPLSGDSSGEAWTDYLSNSSQLLNWSE